MVVFVVGAVGYSLYVGLIKAKNTVEGALSDIDVQLRRRFDTIPNILKIAAKYMKHEKELLEEITKLREAASNLAGDHSSKVLEEKFDLENELNRKMSQIRVAVESYPDLKADNTMSKAMEQLAEIEEDISATRRIYNGAVYDLNNKVEIFPGSLVAGMIGIEARPMYKDADKAKISESIDASKYLG